MGRWGLGVHLLVKTNSKNAVVYQPPRSAADIVRLHDKKVTTAAVAAVKLSFYEKNQAQLEQVKGALGIPNSPVLAFLKRLSVPTYADRMEQNQGVLRRLTLKTQLSNFSYQDALKAAVIAKAALDKAVGISPPARRQVRELDAPPAAKRAHPGGKPAKRVTWGTPLDDGGVRGAGPVPTASSVSGGVLQLLSAVFPKSAVPNEVREPLTAVPSKPTTR